MLKVVIIESMSVSSLLMMVRGTTVSYTHLRAHETLAYLVCRLTVVLPQIFFNLTTLFSYPVFLSLFHAPLDVVVHFLVFLSSFRLEPFLSQFSPFVAQIKKFCSASGFFSSDDVCQGHHWLFQSLLY